MAIDYRKIGAELADLLDSHGYAGAVKAERDPQGRSLEHAKFMAVTIRDEAMSEGKAGRWLGWLQCLLVVTYHLSSLEAEKNRNLRHRLPDVPQDSIDPLKQIKRLRAELHEAQANAADWQRVALRHIGPIEACKVVPTEEIIAQHEQLRGALAELAEREAAYRSSHDLYGDGHIHTGRAWDAMRRGGDFARKLLTITDLIDTRVQEIERLHTRIAQLEKDLAHADEASKKVEACLSLEENNV